MKKKFLICFLVIAMILTFAAGCNGNKPTPTEAPVDSDIQPTTEAVEDKVTPAPTQENGVVDIPAASEPDSQQKEEGVENSPTAKPVADPTEKPTTKPAATPTAKPATPTPTPFPTFDVGDGIVLPDDIW